MVERTNAAPVLPEPWHSAGLPGRDESDADIRRTVARLRAGVIQPVDSTVDPIELAGILEDRLEWRRLAIEIIREMSEMCELISAETGRVEAELVEGAVANLNAGKQLPEANDPTSPLSQLIRRIDRARRHDLGRPRKPGRR